MAKLRVKIEKEKDKKAKGRHPDKKPRSKERPWLALFCYWLPKKRKVVTKDVYVSDFAEIDAYLADEENRPLPKYIMRVEVHPNYDWE